MQEARELANDPSTEYSAAPLEVCPHFTHDLLVFPISAKLTTWSTSSGLTGQLICEYAAADGIPSCLPLSVHVF